MIDSTLGGGVLMGWAHNLGVLLLPIMALGFLQQRKDLDGTGWTLGAAGLLVIAASAWNWPHQISPWPFSAYVAFSMAIGLWTAALARTTRHDGHGWTHAGLAVAVGFMATLALVVWTGMVMGQVGARSLVHAMPGFGNIRAIGHFGAWAMVGAAGAVFALHDSRHRSRLLALFALLAASFVLGWSGGRTGFLAAFLGIALAALIARARWQRVASVGAVVALGFALSVFSPQPNNQFGVLDRMGWVVQSLLPTAEEDGGTNQHTGDATALAAHTAPIAPSAINNASSRRLELWAKGWETIQERPWTGHGLGTWRHDGDGSQYRGVFHLHNLPLDLMHSYGIPLGAALVLLAFAAFLRSSLAAWRIGPTAAVAYGWLVTTAAMSLLDAVAWMPYGAALLGGTIGWLCAVDRRAGGAPTAPLPDGVDGGQAMGKSL